MPILISIHVYPREGESDPYIYRKPQARGILVTKEIEDIGGFKAKT
jgi:hypothetical protein